MAGDAIRAAISVPVLIVLGDRDLFVAPTTYAQRFTGSSDVSTLVVPDSGHMMMIERPAAGFRAALGSWLQARNL